MSEPRFKVGDWVCNIYMDEIFEVLGIERLEDAYWYISYQNESAKVIVNERYLEKTTKEMEE